MSEEVVCERWSGWLGVIRVAFWPHVGSWSRGDEAGWLGVGQRNGQVSTCTTCNRACNEAADGSAPRNDPWD